MDFKLYSRAVVKSACCWTKTVILINRIKLKAGHTCTHLQAPDIWQRGQKSHWRKDHIFNKQRWWNWMAAGRGLKLDSCLSHWTKPQQKPWHPESQQDPNRTDIQTNNWQVGPRWTERFLSRRTLSFKCTGCLQMGKILTSSVTDIRLELRIYKELKKLNTKKSYNHI